MTGTRDIINIKKIYEYFVKRHIDNYTRRPSDSEKFASVIDDIEKGTASIIVAEKIGAILEERFKDIHAKMKGNKDEFTNLLIQLVKSVENTLDLTVNVWKDRVVYFKDVNEVWIACEPMLDLIDNEEGGFDLLERQLNHVNKITYFLTNISYFQDLCKILKSRGKDTSKLQCVKIPKKLTYPVVIYLSDNYSHGMRGRFFPEIRKRGDLEYYFHKPLPKDWLSYIKKDSIEAYKSELNTHYNNCKS